MAASTAIHTYGSDISMSATLAGSYTSLTEICSISDDLTVNPVKVTHLKSDNATHEYVAGFIEPGTVEMEVNFTKAQFAAFLDTIRTKKFFKITDSDGSITAFSAFYQKVGKKIVEDDRTMATVSLKRTSSITFTPAA